MKTIPAAAHTQATLQNLRNNLFIWIIILLAQWLCHDAGSRILGGCMALRADMGEELSTRDEVLVTNIAS